MDAEISDIEVAAPSSSWRTQNSFLSSSLLSDSGCKYCFTEKKSTSNVFSSYKAVLLERVRYSTFQQKMLDPS